MVFTILVLQALCALFSVICVCATHASSYYF